MKRILTVAAVLTAALLSASDRETYRDASGRIAGSATTSSGGRTVYRNASGRIAGSATTSSGGRTVYRDASGRIAGSATTSSRLPRRFRTDHRKRHLLRRTHRLPRRFRTNHRNQTLRSVKIRKSFHPNKSIILGKAPEASCFRNESSSGIFFILSPSRPCLGQSSTESGRTLRTTGISANDRNVSFLYTVTILSLFFPLEDIF